MPASAALPRGEARTATVEKGEEYLELCVKSTELVFREVERTLVAMPPVPAAGRR